jgi:hypothetical protein
MEKIAKEDMPLQLPVKRGRDTRLRGALLMLEVGEGLFLPQEEWKPKNGPASVVSRLRKTSPMRFEYGLKTDGTGWIFRRIK